MINSDTKKYRADFKELANKTIDILEDFKKSVNFKTDNEKLNESSKNINEAIYSGVQKIAQDISYFQNNAEWDNFNIAFFGETNAGKSTLIEALMKGNGNSIGDGRKDFTKTVESKKNSILKNVNILDMPGIEGDESKFVKDIKKAIEKAHIVIYVVGTGKEPEDLTLKRIKRYLKDKAKVYSVLNIRNRPIAYKYKKELIDDITKKVQERIKLKFSEILGGQYEDNIILNAHLGFLSVSEPQREEFIKDKDKAKEIFGNHQDAFKFSNVHALEELIKIISSKSNKEIIVSNSYKFIGSLEKIISKIISEKKKFDSSIYEIRDLLYDLSGRARNLIDKYNREILSLISVEIDRMEINLKNAVNDGIENGQSASEIEKKVNKIKSDYKSKVEENTKYLLSAINESFTLLLQEFKKKVQLKIKISNLKDDKGFIDLNALTEKLDITFRYLIFQALDVGASIFGVIGAFALNPIVGVITAVFVVVRKIWDWFFGDPNKRKREAKDKAYNEISREIKKLKSSTLNSLIKELNKLENQVNYHLQELNLYINNIENVSKFMNDKISNLSSNKKEVCTLLCREILDNHDKNVYSFIDLDLSKIMIVGTKDLSDENFTDIMRVNKVIKFSKFQEITEGLDYRIDKGVLTLNNKDEFIYRALNAFSKNLNVKYVKRGKK